MAVFQGPFFETEFDVSKIARVVAREAARHSATLALVRGPIVSPETDPYLLIRHGQSLFSISRAFQAALQQELEGSSVQRVVFQTNGADPASLGEYPPDAATTKASNIKRVDTTCEELCLGGVYISFAAHDQVGLAWDFVRSNRHSCRGNLKRKMLQSICDQRSRTPLVPRDVFTDPRHAARCHTFGKPLDLLVLCSRKFSTVSRFGSKLALCTQPFVTRAGLRQYAVVSAGAGQRLRVELFAADAED